MFDSGSIWKQKTLIESPTKATDEKVLFCLLTNQIAISDSTSDAERFWILRNLLLSVFPSFDVLPPVPFILPEIPDILPSVPLVISEITHISPSICSILSQILPIPVSVTDIAAQVFFRCLDLPWVT